MSQSQTLSTVSRIVGGLLLLLSIAALGMRLRQAMPYAFPEGGPLLGVILLLAVGAWLVFASGVVKPLTWLALAASPFGKGQNTAQTWKDVNPSLPAVKIRVLGPPPTSGTRDSLADLYLTKGCDTDPAMKALAKTNEDQHKQICTKIREDGAFVEAGENDNLLVQKVSSDAGTLGVLGYSYLEQNADKIRAVKIAGVSPTEATIADLSYPGARKLYIYVKGEHMAAKPKLRDFVAQYAKMWAKGGPLERRGLVPFAGADSTAATQQSTALAPLDPAGLK